MFFTFTPQAELFHSLTKLAVTNAALATQTAATAASETAFLMSGATTGKFRKVRTSSGRQVTIREPELTPDPPNSYDNSRPQTSYKNFFDIAPWSFNTSDWLMPKAEVQAPMQPWFSAFSGFPTFINPFVPRRTIWEQTFDPFEIWSKPKPTFASSWSMFPQISAAHPMQSLPSSDIYKSFSNMMEFFFDPSRFTKRNTCIGAPFWIMNNTLM